MVNFSYNLITKDKIRIAINHYKNNNDAVVLVMPGWCMTKDSDAFVRISEFFAKHFDVITLDFRGHGKSGGMYTFTSLELMDVDAVVRYARRNGYKKIYLAGFSLGAAMALIYGSKSILIDRIIAVSPPSDFDKIENKMWKKEAWGETFKKFEIDRFISIRPNPVFLKKIKPIDIVNKIKAPTLFIAGEKDPTVLPWHTEALFEKAKCLKEYKEFKNGCHAEDLFLHFEHDFTEVCLDWLHQ
ncbi:MAG: lysophospholipase [Muribaculaceae bacterium]|nr:lysophospholipase [Muribaculaceae bacterium]